MLLQLRLIQLAAEEADPGWLSVIPSAALVAGGVAAILALASRLQVRKDKRRDQFSSAYQAAMAWIEMLYRVRRRRGNDDQILIDRFHAIQENLTYHRGWLASESVDIAESFARLERSIKKAVQQPLAQAWAQPIRELGAMTSPDDAHPNVSAASDRFLLDVREYLSVWPWVRRRVRNRNKNLGSE